MSVNSNDSARRQNLEQAVKARLQRQANRLGHSMEEEARDILRNAVRAEERAARPSA
jgi:plasmid stability protein